MRDPFVVLREDLVEAAGRVAVARPRRRWRRLPDRWFRSHRTLIDALAGGLAVVVAVGVALVVLLVGGHRHAPLPVASPPTTRSAAQPLLRILGVLRRPQTAADRAAESKTIRASNPDRDAGLVRLAAVTSWGEQVILVPEKSRPADTLSLIIASTVVIGRSHGKPRKVEQWSGGGSEPVARIEAGEVSLLEGPGTYSGWRGVRLFMVVPDGVAKVAFVLRTSSPMRSPAVTVAVHNNVAFAHLNSFCCGAPVTRWYAADGRLIKVTGTPSNPPPPPPSQTTLTSYLNAAYRETVSRDPACARPVRGFGPGTGTVSEGAPSRALLSVLGVLRRPATSADRLPPRVGNGTFGSDSIVYTRFIRRARVVDGVAYYVVPERVQPAPNAVPLRCYTEQRAALESLVASLPATKGAEIMRSGTQTLGQERQASVGLPTGPYDGIEILSGDGATCCDGVSSLAHQVSIGTTGQTAYGLVADGVAYVTLYYARTDSQDPLTIIAKATHTITATVSDNMYVVDVGQSGRPAAVVYRAANGAVLRRFDTNQ